MTLIHRVNNTTEVKAQATRHRFSTVEKVRILAEVDACTSAGDLSASLRREGMYSSLLASWREQSAAGQLDANAKKRSPVAKPVDSRDAKIAMLERKLQRAELICDVQKKVAVFCGWELATPDDAMRDEPTSK